MSLIQNTNKEVAPLITVKNLTISFPDESGGRSSVVSGLNFEIYPGECLGLVGESGCGKSVAAHSILSLLPGSATVTSGSILFQEQNLLSASEVELQKIRGNRISMVFQEPMNSLNPVWSVGEQVAEVLFQHRDISEDEAYNRVLSLFEQVGIPAPEQRYFEYPHQLSGGMRQRVMIAMALACNPALLIADEPTTALDVSVQRQILKLLKDWSQLLSMSILLISHDLAVVSSLCQRILVMYASELVESAPREILLKQPAHPYTKGLIASVPDIKGDSTLNPIPGTVPDPSEYPSGCHFRDRCPMAEDKCKSAPDFEEIAPDHFVACHFWRQVRDSAGVEHHG
jgi:oligopeptide/dipeptide ABC transporter ATP-binding protein